MVTVVGIARLDCSPPTAQCIWTAYLWLGKGAKWGKGGRLIRRKACSHLGMLNFNYFELIFNLLLRSRGKQIYDSIVRGASGSGRVDFHRRVF